MGPGGVAAKGRKKMQKGRGVAEAGPEFSDGMNHGGGMAEKGEKEEKKDGLQKVWGVR